MKRVDAAALWPAFSHGGRQKAFFFFGDKYTRWDVSADCEDKGYPKKISDGWPGLWTDGIDAAVLWPATVKDADRKNQQRHKAYFFKGLSYIRWDVKADEIDGTEQLITDNWNNWPAGWTKVDAIVPYSDKRIFFFSGKQYAHFERDKNQFTYVHTIADKWPGLPADGIDAAVNWPGEREWLLLVRATKSSIPVVLPWPMIPEFSKAYFFFGKQYCRYDIDKDTLDKGFPHSIEHWWPARSFAVYVALDVPTTPDEDARLHDENGQLQLGYIYPEWTPRGQAGWDLGLNLHDIGEIATSLAGRKAPSWLGGEPIEHGDVNRLAIMAHGYPGEVYGYGVANKTVKLTPTTVSTSGKVRDDLLAIEPWLAPDATVLLMSCRAGGYGTDGRDLLLRLSEVWPGRKVVGFWTIGYADPVKMERVTAGSSTTEAGMRDTEEDSDAVTVEGKAKSDFEARMQKDWDDFKRYPWASEKSLHARVAKDGKMIHDTLTVPGVGGTAPTP